MKLSELLNKQPIGWDFDQYTDSVSIYFENDVTVYITPLQFVGDPDVGLKVSIL